MICTFHKILLPSIALILINGINLIRLTIFDHLHLYNVNDIGETIKKLLLKNDASQTIPYLHPFQFKSKNETSIDSIVIYTWLAEEIYNVHLNKINNQNKTYQQLWQQSLNKIMKDIPELETNPLSQYVPYFTTRHQGEATVLCSIILAKTDTEHLVIVTMGQQSGEDMKLNLRMISYLDSEKLTTHKGWTSLSKANLDSIIKAQSLLGKNEDLNSKYKYINFVGHSLGGAVSMIMAIQLTKNHISVQDNHKYGVLTFGCPPFLNALYIHANKGSEDTFLKRLNIIRVYSSGDPVPKLYYGLYGIKWTHPDPMDDTEVEIRSSIWSPLKAHSMSGTYYPFIIQHFIHNNTHKAKIEIQATTQNNMKT